MRCLSLSSSPSLLPCPSTTIPSNLIPPPATYTPPHRPVNLRSIGYNNINNYNYNSRRRGTSVITRALPSTTTYILAFVFPLSLLAITIFVSIGISDKLDQKFIDELAMEQAMLQEDEDGTEISTSSERERERETEPRRVRNRPKREVESSSM